jgi:hypothetical protein
MADPMAPQGDAVARRYGLLKKQVQQRSNAAADEGRDQLQRQFARGGGLNSGAYIKQSQLAEQKAAEAEENALGQVEASEMGERAQLEETQRNRDFAKSEREAGQSFASAEGALGRAFAREEREGAQQFSGMQADKQRGFERELFDVQQAFQDKQFSESIRQFQENMTLQTRGLDLNATELQRRYTLDQDAQKFNKDMARKQFNKPELTDAIFKIAGKDPKTGKIGHRL